MSYIRILVHVVWRTHNGTPFLDQETRSILFPHILSNARRKQIHMISIGGHIDHVHGLISMSHNQRISEVMQAIKGESSHWLNRHGIFKSRFSWAEEYYAGSVNHSSIPMVTRYIATQEEHHRRVTWEEEVNKFLLENGFSMG